ncbi:MAG: c-type cytochrome [Gemmatimonas sp.]
MFTAMVTATVGGKPWSAPAESDIPVDSVGASIRRGLALLRHVTDSLPGYAPGHINCTNCHLQDGRARYASPLVGAYARYPKYIARSAAVITIADRVNFCMTRSLAGSRLPTDSREMTDIIVYLAWLSKGLPMGAQTPGGDGLPTLKATATPNPAHGAQIYAAKCQSCHQANGGGVRAVVAANTPASTSSPAVPTSIPALWGGASYSVGASMARVERAASFVAHNMPYGQAGTLTTAEAFDVAAYINSQPRPDHPAKEDDWPAGGAPVDLPYSTKGGHTAVNPPTLLPRRLPARTLVPPPPRVRTMTRQFD